MVSVVSALRTFVLLGFGFLAGGLVGGYAVSVVYGDGDRPATTPPQTAPCPVCPVCAPQRPIEDPGRTPDEQVEPEEIEPPEEIEVPQEATRPGLPASAVRLASGGFQRESATCIEQANAAGTNGSLLLDLTVTATGGIGHIRELGVVKKTGEVGALETCLGEAAKRVQFEWRSGEGESKLRYPVQVGSR